MSFVCPSIRTKMARKRDGDAMSESPRKHHNGSMSRWKEFNNNPTQRRVGDCAVRAVSVALDTDWETAYDLIADAGYQMGDMMSADSVWGAVLRQHGFYRAAIPNSCPICYSAEDFAIEHPNGVYVLGFGGHVATVKNGILYDAWDSSNEVPQYVWYKK